MKKRLAPQLISGYDSVYVYSLPCALQSTVYLLYGNTKIAVVCAQNQKKYCPNSRNNTRLAPQFSDFANPVVKIRHLLRGFVPYLTSACRALSAWPAGAN